MERRGSVGVRKIQKEKKCGVIGSRTGETRRGKRWDKMERREKSNDSITGNLKRQSSNTSQTNESSSRRIGAIGLGGRGDWKKRAAFHNRPRNIFYI